MPKTERLYKRYLVERSGSSIRISLRAGLDEVYGNLFYKSCDELWREPSLEACVKVILFGCFWVEAMANSQLQTTMQEEVKEIVFSEALWESVKRDSIHQKLHLIGMAAGPRHRSRLKVFAPYLKQSFDLRNRLVHYKDDYSFLAEVAEDDEKVNESLAGVFFQGAGQDDVGLYSTLSTEAMHQHMRVLRVAGLWLQLIRRRYNDFFRGNR